VLAVAGTVLALVAGLLVAGTLNANAAATLLSQGKPAAASSTENAGTPASAAVDGNVRRGPIASWSRRGRYAAGSGTGR